MMAPLRLALFCALGVLLLAPQAAAGGGWWSFINPNPSTVAPGQRVEVRETVMFDSVAAAEEAQRTGRFYVYLLRDFDYSVVERAMRQASPRNWWSLGSAEAIQVGQVTVTVSDANLARAKAAFTVPELAPATYHLMLCDAGCSEPLADVIPARGFTVAADSATAQVAQRVDRLERGVQNSTGQVAAARRDADRARAAAGNARSELEQLEIRVSSLADEFRSAPRAGPWAFAGWFVAGVLAGALALAALLRRRRRPPPPPPPPVTGGPSDAELDELLESEPRTPARSA